MKVANGDLPPEYFLNGDNAYVLSNQMVVPCGNAANDDFDFEQSSNRICIECAFGILVRRWGILWRPLEMKFRRRAPIISCCMNLHNYCINKSIEEVQMATSGPLSEVVPGRWEMTPKFDELGRPVEYLITRNKAPAESAVERAAFDAAPRDTTRQRLIRAIREKGLTRPQTSGYRRGAR